MDDPGYKMQAAAFVMARSASCMAKLEAMKVANKSREKQGLSPAYGEDDFLNLEVEFALDWNSVIGEFNKANEYF